VEAIDCDECRQWQLNDNGNPILWDGKKIPRGNCPPPCECSVRGDCKKLAAGETFNARNAQAYLYYLSAKLAGATETERQDGTFRENVAVFAEVERMCNVERMIKERIEEAFAMIKGVTGG
jgi:hypothetical protein